MREKDKRMYSICVFTGICFSIFFTAFHFGFLRDNSIPIGAIIMFVVAVAGWILGHLASEALKPFC